MTNNHNIITEQTLNWVRSFIIEHNICPFAKGAVNRDRLRISVSHTTKKADALEAFMSEIRLLDEHPTIETTLLVYPDSFKDFFNYLDFIDLAEQLIILQNYEGIYQVASFHPDYCFADTDPDDVSNYTNRSPYPMAHLLREDLLEKVISAYGDTSQIPEHNIAKMHQLGSKKLKNTD